MPPDFGKVQPHFYIAFATVAHEGAAVADVTASKCCSSAGSTTGSITSASRGIAPLVFATPLLILLFCADWWSYGDTAGPHARGIVPVTSSSGRRHAASSVVEVPLPFVAIDNAANGDQMAPSGLRTPQFLALAMVLILSFLLAPC
ncbi:hypothetical protein M407DRAFT_4400 [Tulasnella calospora MUT 4182]|uniref:Uncharacterized protein n=1 Tax=Tulasnella calospora MUT 4182 TaxID=1051891 RepID=A0A0C3LF99_9AGAM|nr:hypothetical protein M407DRAFT_4400 [Tulasnella calospora MUT 4182]